MAALRSRVRRLHILKKAAGTRRLARIQSTGLTPSVLHGAAVMGVAEHILKPVRTLAGVLAGAKATSSLTMTLVMQRSPRYDPLYKATLELPYMYASWLWDGKASLVDLSQAWEAMVCKMQRAESWSKVTGPLSALWMTLRRVDWSMRSATEVITDKYEHFSLLEVAPRDFRDLLEAGIQRWQLRRIQNHLPDLEGQELWYRGLRACVQGPGAVRDSAELGALHCLWSGSMWPREKKYKHGFCASPDCLACKSEPETLGHRWLNCPALLEDEPGEDEQTREQKRKVKTRELMRMEVLQSPDPNCFDSVQHAYALPLLPAPGERPDRTPERWFEWGDPDVPWEGTVYTDEAGQSMEAPEVARCAWAVVQLDADGRPSKARFGSLPGIQSVPRAARFAGYQAVLASPDVNRIVSDHLSFVQEGERWCEREASAAARHAEIWRAIRATVARQARPHPSLLGYLLTKHPRR